MTFFAIAYIIVLNPIILSSSPDVNGDFLQFPQVAAVTALVAGLMTIFFGAATNFPMALATGLGINSLIAVTIVQHVSWAEAMGLIVLDGIIIVLLALTGIRSAVLNAVPGELKLAITVGIGLFITLIGFVDAGFVRRNPDSASTTVPVSLGIEGSIASWPTAVFLVGLLLCTVLMVRGIKGALLIGIALTTVLAMIVERVLAIGPSFVDGAPVPTGWSLSVPQLPEKIVQLPDFSLIGAVDLFGAFTRVGPLTASLFVFTLVIANFFDAMGSITALAAKAGLASEDGEVEGMKTALVVEGVGAIAGGAASCSSNTVFIDSAAGIADGARTGLSSVITGLLLLLAMFFTPLYSVVPMEAAAPVLILVGAMMMQSVTTIDFSRLDVAIPVFLTMVVMPFTYSIANGIGIGFLAWVCTQAASGRARTVSPLLWIVSLMFVVFFAVGPITSLLTGS